MFLPESLCSSFLKQFTNDRVYSENLLNIFLVIIYDCHLLSLLSLKKQTNKTVARLLQETALLLYENMHIKLDKRKNKRRSRVLTTLQYFLSESKCPDCVCVAGTWSTAATRWRARRRRSPCGSVRTSFSAGRTAAAAGSTTDGLHLLSVHRPVVNQCFFFGLFVFFLFSC